MSDDTQAPESTHALPERLVVCSVIGREGEHWWTAVFDDDQVMGGYTGEVQHKNREATEAFAAELVRRWNAARPLPVLPSGRVTDEELDALSLATGAHRWLSVIGELKNRRAAESADVRELVEALRRLETGNGNSLCPACRFWRRHEPDCWLGILLEKHKHVNVSGALRDLMQTTNDSENAE